MERDKNGFAAGTETGGPKVCVLMPCYNHEKYIGQAIESVLNQTYTNLELHIIDDGSTDNSKQIVASYLEDPRICQHEYSQNTHNFGGRRLYGSCVAASGARYVACIDSDDMWKPDKLRKQVEALEKNRHCKACFTWDEVIHEEGAVQWELPDNYSEMTNRSRYAWFYFFFRWGNRLNASSMLMDRQVYEELGGFDAEFRTLGDFYLWMRLAANYSFYLIPEKLTYYRRHGGNNTSAQESKIQMINEEYLLIRALLVNMEKDFFAKTFSDLMTYTDIDDPLVLAAEKMMLLFIGNRHGYDQIAIEIYIDYASRPGFVELMEKRYGLTNKMLSELLLNCGLPAAFAAKPHGYMIVQPPSRPAILLREQTEQTLTPEKLGQYGYSFLLETLHSVIKSESRSENARNISVLKDSVYKEQKKLYEAKEHRTVVFIVGEDSGWDSAFEPGEWIRPQSDELYYTVLPKQANIAGGASAYEAGYVYQIPDGLKSFEIFFREEYFVGSCMDAGVNPDLIIFADCLKSEYNWGKVMRKYGMDVLFMYLDSQDEKKNQEEEAIRAYLDRAEAAQAEDLKDLGGSPEQSGYLTEQPGHLTERMRDQTVQPGVLAEPGNGREQVGVLTEPGNGREQPGVSTESGNGSEPLIISRETPGALAYREFDSPAELSAYFADGVKRKGAPKLSVAIMSCHDMHSLKKSVDCVLRFAKDIDYELVLMDNASQDADETYRFMRDVAHPRKKVIKMQDNMGSYFNAARGWGTLWNYCEGDYILHLNDDHYVTENAIQNMIRALDFDPSIGMVNPMSSNAWMMQNPGLQYTSEEEMFEAAKAFNVYDPRKWEERIYVAAVAWMFRREVLCYMQCPNPFGPEMCYDIALRIGGYRVMLMGDTWVHHDHDYTKKVSYGFTGHDPEKLKQQEYIARVTRHLFFGLTLFDDIAVFEKQSASQIKPPQNKMPRLLSVDVRAGQGLLDVKNALRKMGIFHTQSTAFSTEAKYYPLLYTIADEVLIDRIESIGEALGERQFDYCIIGTPVHCYKDPQKLLAVLKSKLTPGGELLYKERGEGDIYDTFMKVVNLV